MSSRIRRPRGHDDWDDQHGIEPGEPIYGAGAGPNHTIGDVTALSNEPRRGKSRPIGFRPPNKRTE